MAGTTCLHATGTLADTGERVVVSFGPEHGALEQRQVEHALTEAGNLFPRPKMMVFCAFTFDPEAAKDIDALKGITALKAQMNTDLLTEDLKKARSSNQSFWLMGQPDVDLTQTADGLWQVQVNGFDYFDTVKGELISGGTGKIAMWSLDTDYDGRSLFPHQVFFPMAGKDEGWKKLTFRWALFFFVLAFLNEIVWRTQSNDFWVNFKVFGIMPITIIFALAQTPLLKKYEKTD